MSASFDRRLRRLEATMDTRGWQTIEERWSWAMDDDMRARVATMPAEKRAELHPPQTHEQALAQMEAQSAG